MYICACKKRFSKKGSLREISEKKKNMKKKLIPRKKRRSFMKITRETKN